MGAQRLSIAGKVFASLSLGLLASGCATIYNPATNRQEFVMNTSTEILLGQLARTQMGLTSLAVGQVNPADSARVERIGRQIAQVSDRQDLPYKFGVIQDKSLNAFTLPGGTIYVHTGLLELASADELAGVLGHEMGHAAARHAVKHLQADLGVAALLTIATKSGATSEATRVANSMYQLFSLGYSRQDELEADRLGIRYSKRAGYDPNGLISFFEKLLAKEPETAERRSVAWQSTHPLTSERIKQAKEEIAKIDQPMARP